MRRFFNLFRRNRINIEPERPSSYNPNFNSQMNNDEYEGIEEEEIDNVIGRIPYIGVPIGIATYTSAEIREQIRKLQKDIKELEKEKQRRLRIANDNQDENEIQRIYAEFEREINEYRAILKDWIDESNIAQPYQGDGLKQHKQQKKPNRWVLHTKAYAKKYKVPYYLALKEAKKSYKKSI